MAVENGENNSKEYMVNCWCNVATQIRVTARSEEEAKEKAWDAFEGYDLNRCCLGDYGTDIVDIAERM